MGSYSSKNCVVAGKSPNPSPHPTQTHKWPYQMYMQTKSRTLAVTSSHLSVLLGHLQEGRMLLSSEKLRNISRHSASALCLLCHSSIVDIGQNATKLEGRPRSVEEKENGRHTKELESRELICDEHPKMLWCRLTSSTHIKMLTEYDSKYHKHVHVTAHTIYSLWHLRDGFRHFVQYCSTMYM